MTSKEQIEQELKEKIDKFEAKARSNSNSSFSCPPWEVDNARDELLDYIKSACYLKADGELPQQPLSKDVLDAIDVVGITPHIATAITLALVRQANSIQQEMLQPDPEGRVWASVYKTWE